GLRLSSEINWVLQRNLRFLDDCLAKPPTVEQRTAQTVLTLVEHRPGLQLAELLDTLGEARADDVYALIATDSIFVDLHVAPLAEPEQVQLFRDHETASAYALTAKAKTFAVSSPAAHQQH